MQAQYIDEARYRDPQTLDRDAKTFAFIDAESLSCLSNSSFRDGVPSSTAAV